MDCYKIPSLITFADLVSGDVTDPVLALGWVWQPAGVGQLQQREQQLPPRLPIGRHIQLTHLCLCRHCRLRRPWLPGGRRRY